MANTEISSGRRDASTTDAETAVFIDITEVNLRTGDIMRNMTGEMMGVVAIPFP